MGIFRTRIASLAAVGIATLTLAGCDDSGKFNLAGKAGASDGDVVLAEDGAVARAAGGFDNNVNTVEQDVEAPDVFSATEAGLWDGRPSLGGIWVAHPDVDDPERVLIRNPDNGKFVVGALFRRERDIPGPRLQVSSDAAAALGILAGSPTELDVTALRREQVKIEPPAPLAEPVQVETTEVAPVEEIAEKAEAAEITEQALDPIAIATAALADAPEDNTAIETVSTEPLTELPPETEETAAVATPKPSKLSKAFIQVGIFGEEANAKRTADQMRNAGMLPMVKSFENNGKPFWRVVVGPATTRPERRELLAKIKEVGFTDAYAVTN